MKKTLGLDLGTNSLGWAILDDLTGDILDKGVVVFPEGIDATNDTLETPAAIRRAKRMGRRMKFRRKMRKWVVLQLLIENGMCPMTEEERLAWKNEGKYPVANKAFIDWLKATDSHNPYCDRAAAATGKVDPLVLGRALYHIAQRRGFKSSRKEEVAEDSTTAKESGVVKGDIKKLTEEIVAAGCKTLGQYFHQCLERNRNQVEKTRIRTRHTGRVEHYMSEFTVIMEMQGVGKDLQKKLYDALFLQRPLRSQKHLVGNCPLEPKSPRVQIGHPAYEEFRMLSFVNNLSFVKKSTGENVPLSPSDRSLVASAFLKASPTMKFKEVSKLFKTKFKNEDLAFYHYRDEETVACCSTRHRIASAFSSVAYDEQKVFDALMFFDNADLLAQWFKKHYPELTNEQISKACAIHPKEGNAQYSLKAINKMLPFLRKGFDLFLSRFLAKLPEIIPDFAAHEDEITLHLQELIVKQHCLRDEVSSRRVQAGAKVPRLLDLWRDYFLTEWGVDDDAWNRLYLRGDSVYSADPQRPTRLPAVELGMIRNPLVQRSMTTLRRLVNYLRDHDKIDGETTIRIELARGVNDYATRRAIKRYQEGREKQRLDAAQEIIKIGVAVTEDAIDRYLLWEEQGHQCLYTGESIGLGELFKGERFDIEHTIPRSKSGDDSLANKTICELTYNRQIKKGNVPKSCPNYDEIYIRLAPWRTKVDDLDKTYRQQKNRAKIAVDPGVKAQARIKAIQTRLELNYWRDKLYRFEVDAGNLEDPENGLSGFKKRQLVDSGIMSSHAVEFLRSVYEHVYAVNGSATAFARKAWGIQSNDVKDRSEHTHHAKDAMVIAALTPARFTAICTALKDDGGMSFRRPCDVCPEPYPHFAEKVWMATEEILVKHVLRRTTLRQSSKRNVLAKQHESKSEPGKMVRAVTSRGDTIRGQLHKDTFYGCIANPATGKNSFVVRKPLVGQLSESEKLVPKIVDPAICEIVRTKLAELKVLGVKNIEHGMIKMPSGVPINKVRVFDRTTSPYELRSQSHESSQPYKNKVYVSSSPNFRLAIFSRKGRFSYETESALTWAQNHKLASYIPANEKDGFCGYVYPGCMLIAHQGGGVDEVRGLSLREISSRLYYARVLPSDSDNHAELQYHLEARMKKDIDDEVSAVDIDRPHGLIRTSAGRFLNGLLFEGIHFRMALDGTITFLQ